jgi:hypothetical protein
LEAEATKLNRPELVPQMKEARVEIAKTHAVERALNLGDGTIDAQAIGRAYDNGAKLTGRLETIAKFALGPGKQVSRPSASVPAPGVSALDYMSSLGLGLGGYGTMGTKGVALAALPYLRPMARDLVASNWYQNKFAIPDYKPPFEPQSLASMLVQQANMANQK